VKQALFAYGNHARTFAYQVLQEP